MIDTACFVARLILRTGILLVAIPSQVAAKNLNGFEIIEPMVPIAEIRRGGPPRDGIPAIDNPRFTTPDKADFLEGSDRVLGIFVAGEARAYPIKVLDWHEVVNDRIGAQHVVVSYCPLCGSGLVFASNTADGPLIFGVSGLLYDSDVLMFDRNTESLWSQLMSQAISGPLKGTVLPQLPAMHTTWEHWLERHPDSRVMTTETGHRRNYDRSPYINYTKTRRLYFKVSNKAPQGLHTKELVMGVVTPAGAKAYPFSVLERGGQREFDDQIGDFTYRVHWESSALTAWLTDNEGVEVPTTIAYWFAWYTFHPDTQVYRAESAGRQKDNQ